MTDTNIKRKATKDSEEKSESNANSKEDENLMQNWSLTFTEYAVNNQYHGDFNMKGIDPTPEPSSEQFRLSRPPDGRGYHLDAGRQPNNLVEPVQIHGLFQKERQSENTNIITEKIDVQLPQAEQLSEDKQSVTIEGKAMSIARSRDKTSALTRERNSAQLRKSENASVKSSRESQSGISERNVRENRERLQNIQVQKQGEISKHPLLPAIGNQHSPREKPEIVRVGRRSQAGNVRNTPPPQKEGYGGKVQPIYVRLPGQRTGQMML